MWGAHLKALQLVSSDYAVLAAGVVSLQAGLAILAVLVAALVDALVDGSGAPHPDHRCTGGVLTLLVTASTVTAEDAARSWRLPTTAIVCFTLAAFSRRIGDEQQLEKEVCAHAVCSN